MKKIILTVFTLMFCYAEFTAAQNNSEKKPSPQWWLNSSLADTIDRCLYHIEGQYSYTKMTGSIDGEMQSGSSRITIRKNIFTNQAEYVIDKMDLALKSFGMNYATEAQAFTDYVDVDFTKLFYGETGFIWERDNSLYIKNRYSLYLGAGVNGLIFNKHYLKVLIAAGRINQDYSVPVDNIDVVKGAYTAFYVRQHYKYVMDQRFSFFEQAYYLDNTGHSDRYRMSVSLNFIINIFTPVSLVLGYTYKYDREAELLGAIAKNTTQSVGVNISL